MFALLAGAALFAPSASHAEDDAISSRYTNLQARLDNGQCVEFYDGMVEEGRDFGILKCNGFGGIPVWWTFSDSARIFLGFGEAPHQNTWMFGTDRDNSWPVEWRGVERGMHFEPFAVIIRMTDPHADVPPDGAGFLYVFRLRGDGTSCLLGGNMTSNEEARAIADASLGGFECRSESHVWDDMS